MFPTSLQQLFPIFSIAVEENSVVLELYLKDLKDSKHKDLLAEIGVSAFLKVLRDSMLMEVTYGNFESGDINVYVPGASVGLSAGGSHIDIGEPSSSMPAAADDCSANDDGALPRR